MNSFWKNKKIFITGANGFLGSWLTESLIEKDSHVVALVRDFNADNSLLSKKILQKIDLIQGKLEDFSLLERVLNEYEIDTVFHLGAQTLVEKAIRSPFQTFESNIRGTYNLLEACKRHLYTVKRVVVASSDKAYGISPILPYKEEMPLQGRAPYDVSKSCTDLIALSYAQTYQLPIVIARCGNLYGGGDFHWSRIIPGTIRSLLNNAPPLIRSNGKLTRDYLYVKDAVEAYLLMGMKADQANVSGQAFNISPHAPTNVLEIVTMIQKIMHFEAIKPVILNTAVQEIPDQSLDSSKAHSILGWQASYSLEKGLQETIAWYESYLNSRVTV